MSTLAQPGASAARERSRPILANVALWSLFGAVVLLLTVSEPLLDRLGYHYFTSGGGPWEKFHPGTLLALVTLGARIAASGTPLRTAGRVIGSDGGVILYVLAVAIAGAHAALVSRLPVTGLVDTFLAPVLFCLLLDGLAVPWRRRLALLVCGLLAANAVIGLVESLTDWRLVPIDVPAGVSSDPGRLDVPFDAHAALAQDRRSRAFLGHPLENAVVMGAFVLCLAAPGARWLSSRLRVPLLGLSALSLIPFGGRAGLVLSLAGALLFGLAAAGDRVRRGIADWRPVLAAICLSVLLMIAAACALAASGFLDRTLERFSNDDGSANARVVMWQMLEPQSWWDLLLAPDQALVQTWQRLLGIDFGVESFWLGLALTYGLVVGAILACGLAVFSLHVARRGGRGAGGVLLYFFLVGSTSTSLSSKTVSFAIVVLLVLLVLPRTNAVRPTTRAASA